MMRGAGLTEQPDNGFSNIGEVELAARNKAVARENKNAAALRTLINTRRKQLKDEPPPPDLLRASCDRWSARTRQAWAEEWHREQAGRHRTTLTDLIAHHEAAASRLEGGGA